jgi:pimeloyl-ACP methyl ester carboxylesterase
MSHWILLRGLTREARHWGSFPETLGRAIPDARLLAPDLPGNGTLCAQPSPLRVEAMAEAIRSDLMAQGIAPPYHLLAMSLGAMVAIAWAARHPDEIAGAVLINTSLRRFSPFHRRLKPGNYPRLLRLALCRGSDREREQAIFALTSRQAAATPRADEVIGNWLAYRRQHPVTLANALRQLIAALRYRAPAARPPVPLLILASRRDALVDSACSRQLAQHWQAPLAVHPDAGHDLPLDDGAWVAQQIGRWLASLADDEPNPPTPAAS